MYQDHLQIIFLQALKGQLALNNVIILNCISTSYFSACFLIMREPKASNEFQHVKIFL